MAANRKPTGIVSSVDEVEMDTVLDDDVLDITEIGDGPFVQALDEGADMGPRPDNIEQGEAGGRWEGQRSPHEPQPTVADTKNFHGVDRSLAEWQSQGDEVEIEAIIVQDEPEEQQFIKCRVGEDIGPAFYGAHEYELKKGVMYKMPIYLHDFLYERGKIWSYA